MDDGEHTRIEREEKVKKQTGIFASRTNPDPQRGGLSAHPPRSLLAAEALSLFRSVDTVAAFSLAQPLRIPTETKLGGSAVALDAPAVAGDLELLLLPPAEPSLLTMNPAE